MTAPKVFISYSHKDEEWKDKVVTHLRVLEMEGMLDVWEDRRIEAGDGWFKEIEQAINAASIAILLISANFLTSKFIRDKEVSRLLARREKEGVRVIPIIVKPCVWTQVRWLSPIQARPKDGRALSAGNENQIDTDLAALAEEISRLVKCAETIGTKKHTVLVPDKVSPGKPPSTSPEPHERKPDLPDSKISPVKPQLTSPNSIGENIEKEELEKERARKASPILPQARIGKRFKEWWNDQTDGVKAAYITGVFTLFAAFLVLLNSCIDNRPTLTPTPVPTCITADDILVKFRILRGDDVIDTLSSRESISLEPGVVVDFEVVITPIKVETLPTFEYTWTNTGIVTDGKLLRSTGRIVDYQSGRDFIDDAISMQLSQPDCLALAPYPFFVLPNKK